MPPLNLTLERSAGKDVNTYSPDLSRASSCCVRRHARRRPGIALESYFNHHSDEEIEGALGALGNVVAVETLDCFDDGGHYQFARVVAR